MAIGSGAVGGAAPSGILTPVISLVMGVVVLVVIYMIIPTIAGQISQSMPTLTGPASITNPWNTSNASNNIPNGVSLWMTVTGMVAVIVVVISAVYILRYIMAL